MASHCHISILSEEHISISEVNTSWKWHTKKLSVNNLNVKSTGKESEIQKKNPQNANPNQPNDKTNHLVELDP